MPAPPPYVSNLGSLIFVDHCFGVEEQLTTLGFVEDRESRHLHRYQKDAPMDKQALANELAALRQLGIVFSEGRDWSPSAVFEQLREEGLISGRFLSIAWRSPGDWKIFET